jgi:hypothetical protein
MLFIIVFSRKNQDAGRPCHTPVSLAGDRESFPGLDFYYSRLISIGYMDKNGLATVENLGGPFFSRFIFKNCLESGNHLSHSS